MKRFINFIKNNIYIIGIKMFVMLVAILFYLLNTDLSSAPEFIYSQF